MFFVLFWGVQLYVLCAHSPIKRSELLIHIPTWMNLKVIFLNERSQSQKVRYYMIPNERSQSQKVRYYIDMIPFIWHFKNCSAGEQIHGYQGLGIMGRMCYKGKVQGNFRRQWNCSVSCLWQWAANRNQQKKLRSICFHSFVPSSISFFNVL